MNEAFKDDSGWPWYWKLLILLSVIGFFLAIAIPNRIGGGPSKINYIINNLRQIDAAKSYWAFERGFTNDSQVLQLTNQLTEQDLRELIHHADKKPDLVTSVDGEIYSINPMNRGPEAKLAREQKFGNQTLPKGTIIRLETDPANGLPDQIILPDGTKFRY